MASSVIHVSPEAHVAVKSHCRDNGWRMSEWASVALLEAVRVQQATVDVRPVARRSLEQIEYGASDCAADPPFWKKP